MEKRQLKARSKRVAAVAKPAAAASTETVPKGTDRNGAPSPCGSEAVESGVPPPEYLVSLAMKESDRKLLEGYIDTIYILRDLKNFSFREIADWLIEHGVEANYNDVYRAYTKGLPEDVVARMDKELSGSPANKTSPRAGRGKTVLS